MSFDGEERWQKREEERRQPFMVGPVDHRVDQKGGKRQYLGWEKGGGRKTRSEGGNQRRKLPGPIA